MIENNISTVRPLYNARPQTAQSAASEPVGGATGLGQDQLALTGASPQGQTQQQYAQFVSDTIAFLGSTDVRQRYQAIINMTKMQPAEALPLLQKAMNDSDPQVQALAKRAYEVIQKLPSNSAAVTSPAPAATTTTPVQTAAPQPAAVTQAPTTAAPAAPVASTPPPAQAAAPQPVAVTQVQATAAPVAPPSPPPAGAPQTPGEISAFLRDVNKSNDEKVNVIRSLDYFATTNRQETVMILLERLSPADGSYVGMEQQLAAIEQLKKLGVQEAKPYLQVLAANSGPWKVLAPVVSAASSALSTLSGQQPTVQAPATTQQVTPQQVTPQQVTPQQVTPQPATTQLPATPQPTTTIPSFLTRNP